MDHEQHTSHRRRPAAQRVLRAAAESFYAEGIHAVGVDTLAARAGVAKMSLYNNFGSKNDLVAAYLRTRDERWREWLHAEVERRAHTAKDRILAFFDASRDWMREESPRGCAFINALAEIPDTSHPARQAVADQKHWTYAYLVRLAREAGANDPDDVAGQLFVLAQGAAVTSVIGIVDNPWRHARTSAATVIRDL